MSATIPNFNFRVLPIAVSFVLIVVGYQPWTDDSQENVSDVSQFRRPVAIEVLAGDRCIVANQDSGTVSIVDYRKKQVIGEYEIVKQCGDLIRLTDHGNFVVSDSKSGLVRAFSRRSGDEDGLEISWTLKTAANPTKVELSPDGIRLAISCKWARQLTLVECSDSDWRRKPDVELIVDLPFSPGAICWIENSKLLVADAFGSNVALVSVADEEVSFVRGEISGHRTGGLAMSSDSKWVGFSDQRLNPLAHSTRNDVHWGLMISNQLRWLSVESLKSAADSSALKELFDDFVSHPVGRPGDAKADLGCIEVSKNGTVAFTVGGVNELAIGRRDENNFAFVEVGCRPIAVACTPDSEFAIVANMLDDSISVVDLDEFTVASTIRLGDRPELDNRRKGERLFFDASLSHDNWMSCHSCHIDGHTNGALNDNFSDGSFHSPKQVISLLGHGDTLPLTWTGNHADFETQMRRSIESTMQADSSPTEQEVAQLALFVRSLPGPPAVSAVRGTLDRGRATRGEKLFASLECVRCHVPPNYTTNELYEVGVKDENGESKFNPPSLIGLGQRDRFFHDARFDSLEQLLVKEKHQLPRGLRADELSDLIEFLKSL